MQAGGGTVSSLQFVDSSQLGVSAKLGCGSFQSKTFDSSVESNLNIKGSRIEGCQWLRAQGGYTYPVPPS